MLVATLPLVRGSCIILLEDEISMWASLFWKVFFFLADLFLFLYIKWYKNKDYNGISSPASTDILIGIKTKIITVFRV